jgi:hypothetical protein
MKLQITLLAMAVFVILLTLGPTLANLSLMQTAEASAYCQGHKSKYKNWKDGCESGTADCKGGKDFSTGSGHTADFKDGYRLGWANAGCYVP